MDNNCLYCGGLGSLIDGYGNPVERCPRCNPKLKHNKKHVPHRVDVSEISEGFVARISEERKKMKNV
jgi:hypothetical protein